jgi:hypothetical protein
MIEVGPYIESDNIYPPVLGEISDDSTPWSEDHCMMASHGDGNENRDNDGRNRTDSGRQVVTHDQIRFARRVYASEVNFGPNPTRAIWLHSGSSSRSRRTRSVLTGEYWNDAERRPMRPAEDGPKDRLIIHQASSTDRDHALSRGPICTISPEI